MYHFIFCQQCMRIPVFSHPHQHLVWLDFLFLAILTGVWFYPNIVLICISLMTNDVEHPFMYLFRVSPVYLLWWSVYSNNLPIFIWLGIVLFGFQSFYLLYVQILYHIYNWQMFSHSLWFIIFYSLNTVFWIEKFLVLIKFNL